MSKFYKVLFFNSILIGTLVSVSAYSWFVAWIGLEINLLSIIPLLKIKKNKYPSERALKYFITQVIASSILLFSIIYFFRLNNSLSEALRPTEALIISTSLLLKIGAAPFHFWLPEVLRGLTWSNVFLILTWQKIAPIVLFSYNIRSNILYFSIIIISSSIIRGLQGLNQVCLRKILAYSSINHLSWIISAILNSLNICIFYFIIYSLINLNIIIIFNKFKVFYLNQLISIFSYNKKIKFFFILNFLSLGGLPPFLGFFPKWLVINNITNTNNYTLACILIIFTLISLYFYLRITFSSYTIFTIESLIILFNKIRFFQFITNSLSLLGLIICTFTDSII